MRLLLDTHMLLWWLSDDDRLPANARMAISNPDTEIFVSAATVWEIAIKQALGRLDFPVGQTANILQAAGFAPLGIDTHHAVIAGGLPLHHGDPFDRMLVAQAQCEGLTLVSADAKIRLYAVAVLD